MKTIPDKAEVALEFPDKAYVGSFGQTAKFEAKTDALGVVLRLQRHDGETREVDIHIHHGLFAEILEEIARAIKAGDPIDARHRADLLKASRHLAVALGGKA